MLWTNSAICFPDDCRDNGLSLTALFELCGAWLTCGFYNNREIYGKIKGNYASLGRILSGEIFFFPCRKERKSFQMIESLVEWISVTKSLVIVPAFFTFLVSTFVLYIFFDIPYVNFPEYAVEHLNVTETEASYLVSAIGLMNMISMLLCGFLADWTYTREVRPFLLIFLIRYDSEINLDFSVQFIVPFIEKSTDKEW